MKKVLIMLSVVAFGCFTAQAQPSASGGPRPQASVHESLGLETDQIFDKLVKIRRSFHQNPELAGHEKQTQATIKQYLLDLGLEVKTNLYGYGVVGVLKGAKAGRHLAWRADMDALPHDFADRMDFRSVVEGVQHGCGHDVHMAIALGLAEVLAKNKQVLCGTVYFVFQPEEETFRGAKNMIASGLFDEIAPQEIYGLHVTALPVGQIMVKENELFSYQKGLRIRLKNTLTPSQIAALTDAIRSALVRTHEGSRPWEMKSVLDLKIGLANPNTIFKNYLLMDEKFVTYTRNDTLVLEADLYETDAARLRHIIPTIRKVVAQQPAVVELYSVEFAKENPTVLNSPKLTDTVFQIFERLFGKGYLTLNHGQVPFFNDDFAYFQQKIPGVYFFLGGSNFEKGMIAMNHAPNFEVDEECIRTAVRSFSSLIYARLSDEQAPSK